MTKESDAALAGQARRAGGWLRIANGKFAEVIKVADVLTETIVSIPPEFSALPILVVGAHTFPVKILVHTMRGFFNV